MDVRTTSVDFSVVTDVVLSLLQPEQNAADIVTVAETAELHS